MNNEYAIINLVPCPNCNKKFAQDRLEVHLRLCKPIKAKSKSLKDNTIESKSLFLEKLEKELKNTTLSEKRGGPVSLFCYICGREFGTQSLGIHLKTCEQAYLRDHSELPTKPTNLDNILTKKTLDADEIVNYNKEAEKIYKDVNFVACPNCSRKFLPDRLELHLKGCKTISKIKGKSPERVNSNTITSSTKILEEKLNKELGGGNNTSMGFNIGGKPLFLICYCCGREFGKHSLEIHLKTCLEKFENEEKGKRKMAPTPEELELIFCKLKNGENVDNSEIIKYNEIADKIYKEYGMKACPGCKRRFFPDRLEVHLRSCKEAANLSPNKSPMKSKPKMLICPLCGREFGTLSLNIHMKTCKNKFEIEQSVLPKSQRRSADNIIDKFNEGNKVLGASGKYDIEAMNENAYEIWIKESLVPCETCGRTFIPDRLLVHQRSCKKKIN